MTGRVDMLTSPVAAARAAAATGAYLIRGGVGDQALFFTHPPKDLKKKKKMTNDPTELVSCIMLDFHVMARTIYHAYHTYSGILVPGPERSTFINTSKY